MTETLDPPNLYEEVLSARGDEPLPAAKPPRGSAAIVLWRYDAEDRLQVYWVERSERVRFMPGWFAFIGGTVSRADSQLPVAGEPRGLAAQNAPESLPPGQRDESRDVRGLVGCALRELFEEVGILVTSGTSASSEVLTTAREAALEDPSTFGRFLESHQLELDARDLVFAGRWLTPPFAPLRFDNRFYLLEWPADRSQQPEVWPGELASGQWVSPREAQERWLHGEVLAAPPILHILSVLAQAGPREALPRLQRPTEAELGPYRRVEFRPGILMFPLPSATLPPATHTNCYLLGQEEAVVVDPGSGDPKSQDDLVAALQEAEARLGRRPTAIWLTHHHPDHIAGVEPLRRRLGLPVLAHPQTGERLRAVGIELDGLLEDGHEQELGPGYLVRVHHTPGHARGHIALYAETHGALLCGDLVSALSTIIIDPPEGNMGQYLDSLQRMADLQPDTLFPSHGPILARGGRFLAKARQHRLWREERVYEAWQVGLREPAEILPRVYEEIPRMIWPLAERQIRAHIEHLQEIGRI